MTNLPSALQSPFPQIFSVLFTGDYKKEQVTIDWQDEYQSLPTSIESEIDSYWQQTVLNTRVREYVFDGELAALNSWRQIDQHLHLNLFPTKYRRQFFARKQYNRFKELIEQNRLASALGISIILASADHQIILMQRSMTVGESPGKVDVVGGHIEPTEHTSNDKPCPFSAIQAEMQEEINYKVNSRETIRCFGLVETVAPRKPELYFYLKSRKSAREILQFADKISCNEFERLFTIPDDTGAIICFLEKERDRLSKSALGVLWTYSQTI